jgi:hypothetical protein
MRRGDEMIEDITRAQRYRGVLVVAAVIGIVASAAVAIATSVGGLGPSGNLRDSSTLGFLVLPFAASMVVGGGVYNTLLFLGKRRRRR